MNCNEYINDGLYIEGVKLVTNVQVLNTLHCNEFIIYIYYVYTYFEIFKL